MTVLARLLVVLGLVALPADAARPPGDRPPPPVDVPAALALLISLRPGRIEVVLINGQSRPVSSTGAEGSAVLVVNGRELGVALLPAGGNRLVGLAPYQPGDEVGAEVSVSVHGRTVKARYGIF